MIKKSLFLLTSIILVLSMSCTEAETEIVVSDVYAIDISRETDWNYMIVGKDGSSVFFNVDENTNIPTHMYLKPDKYSDNGFTFLLKENGLLDKMIYQDHILYFGNYNDYRFDLAIIYPDNTIEYFYDIETEVNWNSFNYNNSFQGRSALGDIFGIVKHVIGLGSCVAGFYFQPALGACARYVVKEVIGQVFDGFTEGVGKTTVDIFGCASGSMFSCISGLASSASLLSYLDFNLANEKTTEINEAIRKIDGDGLTVIPRDLLEYFLLLGIEINNGRNPPNIEGTFLATPLQLVKSTAGSIAQQWDMYVTFSKQNYDKLTVGVDYIIQSDQQVGPMLSIGTSFIVGESNKFTVFMEGTREQLGYTAKTVEVFSGEITATGIRNYQWAVFMIDNRGNPLGVWISNGTGYFKRDSDKFSEKIY